MAHTMCASALESSALLLMLAGCATQPHCAQGEQYRDAFLSRMKGAYFEDKAGEAVLDYRADFVTTPHGARRRGPSSGKTFDWDLDSVAAIRRLQPPRHAPLERRSPIQPRPGWLFA